MKDVVFYTYLRNSQDNVLINTLTLTEMDKLNSYLLSGSEEGLKNDKSKYKLIHNDDLFLYVVARSQNRFPVSKNTLDNYANLLQDVFSNIEEAVDKIKGDTRRILHNIVSLNSFNNQEFDGVFSPEEMIGLSHKKMITYMADEIKKNPKNVAKSMLKIHKNNNEINYELDIFKYILNPNYVLRRSNQNIHRVTKRILDTFFLDFLDKGIDVYLNTENDEVVECELNFDCLRYAIYNIFHNALKYSKNDSSIDVEISKHDNLIRIDFNMISLKIKDDEVDRIFFDGYCGQSSKDNGKNGDGVGLYMSSLMLSKINGKIKLNRKEEYKFNNILYQRNIFSIQINI